MVTWCGIECTSKINVLSRIACTYHVITIIARINKLMYIHKSYSYELWSAIYRAGENTDDILDLSYFKIIKNIKFFGIL